MRTIAYLTLILGLFCGCGDPKSETASTGSETKPEAKPAEKPKPKPEPAKPKPPPPVAEKDKPIEKLTVTELRDGLLGDGVGEEEAAGTWKTKFVGRRVGWSGRVIGINNMGQSFIVELALELVAHVTPMERAESLQLSQWVTFEATVRDREPYPLDWAPRCQSIQLSHGVVVGILPTSPELGPLFNDLSHEDQANRLKAVKALGAVSDMVFCNEVGMALMKVVENETDPAVVLEGIKAILAVKKKAGERFNLTNTSQIMAAMMSRVKGSSDEAFSAGLLEAAQGLEGGEFGYHGSAVSEALGKATTPDLIAVASAIMGEMGERHKMAAEHILQEKASKGASEETRKAAADALAGLKNGK